ncbi:MAG TPA: RDD family protein [Mycobacteriales bacterium]|nr:RDD family protein [Mycobacteriales bacterium]
MAEPSRYVVAPIGRRVAAWSIDVALGALLATGFVLAVGGERDLREIAHLVALKSANRQTGHALASAANLSSPDPEALKPILGLLGCFALIAISSVAYRVVTNALWGAGVGKLLLRLRVVVDDNEAGQFQPPGWARSWRRWLVPQLPGLIPLPATGLLAYLPAFKDGRRRGLHDRAAGTIVVDLQPARPSAEPEPAVTREVIGDYYVSPSPASYAAQTTDDPDSAASASPAAVTIRR